MRHIEHNFWQGYVSLFAALGAAQLVQQVDMAIMARLGGCAPGAYALLTRLAIVDTVLTMAIGAVASTAVTQAQGEDERVETIGRVLIAAVLAGLVCCAFGLAFYPAAGRQFAGDGEVANLIATGAVWYCLASPFRFLVNAAAFILHAQGFGALMVRWKLVEVAARTATSISLWQFFGFEFSACLISSLLVGGATSIWLMLAISKRHKLEPTLPTVQWGRQFFFSTLWEAQRLISVQLALLACLALFSTPWLGQGDIVRLNSFATGQTLMLIIFAPFTALLRFLAFRFAAIGTHRRTSAARTIFLEGAPVATVAAFILFVSDDWIGRLYGQHGPWWSILIEALSISLPIRFMGNVLRAFLHAQNAFSVVATLDSAGFWLLATPLVAIGLYVDSPYVAYSSLILPEAICAGWMLRRVKLGGAGDRTSAGTLFLPQKRSVTG